jgi:hypothetical protein
VAGKIERLRAEARGKWRWASGVPEERSGELRDVAMAEPPPVPKKAKRVFEV